MTRKRRKAEGEETRPSVDYMDFDKPGGGPTRRLVGSDGILEVPKEEGEEQGEGGPTPEGRA